uniref:Uncharacterized protein n=1 Tax=Romanomermis culicivorax TaxID=13658 RepID=A0A915KHI8_ROMCU
GAVFLYEEVGVKDISKQLLHLHKHSVLRFRFAKGFVFANHQSANEFEDQRARFFQENEQRDDYMEVKEGMELANILLKDKLIVFGTGRKAPWFLNSWCFWLLSILLLSWPLRILIAYKTAYVNYHVTKLFGTNYLSPTNQNYTGPLARVPTVDSQDLEAIDNQGNLHIRTRSSTETLNNEGVLTNYGAFEARWWPHSPGTNLLKSSTSLSLKRLTAVLQQYNKKHLQHMILNRHRRNRSIFDVVGHLTYWYGRLYGPVDY